MRLLYSFMHMMGNDSNDNTLNFLRKETGRSSSPPDAAWCLNHDPSMVRSSMVLHFLSR